MQMVGKNLKLIFSYLKLNIQKELQYKTSFFLKVIMMVANNAFFIIQWYIIFSLVDNIAGYTFNDVILIWGISAGGYGLAHLLFANAFNIDEIIYEGKLDVYLTQPKSVLINLISSSTSVSAIGDILYCFIALAIIGAPWWWYIAIIPVIIISAIIFIGCVVTFKSIAFYVKKGGAVADVITHAIVMFGTYPGRIFTGLAKVILYTIVPVGVMVFLPAENIFMAFDFKWIIGFVSIAIFWSILAFVSFKVGLKKYNSGNLMSSRL